MEACKDRRDIAVINLHVAHSALHNFTFTCSLEPGSLPSCVKYILCLEDKQREIVAIHVLDLMFHGQCICSYRIVT